MEYCYEQIMQAIYDAIAEINARIGPRQALQPAPDTVLIGKSGNLDSLGFVNLIVAVEQNIERRFRRSISLMDALISVEGNQWTVAALAVCIAERLDGATREQHAEPARS